MAQQNDQQPLDIEALLSDLSNRVERVKVLYEQYFMGIEKIEPLVARKDIQRTMLMLQQMYIRNTGLRFRFNTLLQKWNIYITYWNRILREIEAGTYTRHLAKVQRAAAREGKAVPDEVLRAAHGKVRPPSGTFDTGAPVDKRFLDSDSERHVLTPQPKVDTEEFERIPVPTPVPARAVPPPVPMPPPIPGAAAKSRPPSTPPRPVPAIPGMSEPELRALHQKYVATRRQAGESTQVSYETLVNSLAKQVPNVLAQPGVKSVRFDVALQNGKTVLKAIPQKK